ncbi:hypothetical protein WBP06_15310 [Novosphingobium sp. BL-8H]|uniref:hypothetical protein n=1 Tax=Novosphingobium sp. BL-8H TaxID=3127640 RepID=UPI003756B1B6
MNASGNLTGRRGITASPVFWGLAFFAVMAVIAGLQIAGVIGASGSLALMLVAGPAMIVPMMRSANRLARESGCGSPAVRRFNTRMGVSSAGYVVALGLGIWCWQQFHPGTVVTVALALAVVVPIFGMIWATARYLHEETDEYLRQRAAIASLYGLGAVLALGSLWGFLETFRLVPHVPGWAVVPVWAIGMGIGQFRMSAGKR